MIPQITEIGFPSYATLHQANISLSEMGSRVITTQVRIDGDITPDFSGWELEFKGERFVLPIRIPQATKDNSTRNGIVDLTFYSWAEDQLKRYFFMSLSEVKTGVAIADQYVASVTMPVEQFVTLFNSVLQYYFGDRIRMDLFQMGQGIYSTNPVIVEINYTHIWDVLTKFYETFSLRWNIEYDSTTSAYVIKVNYPSDAIEDHDFEYGYKGGLLKFERQVQDDGITNILLGRGGEKNLPYRYFKRTDQQNPEWQADPDAVYELRSIYFDRLRDINFRWYVRGWMQNPNRDRTWENQGYTYPTYSSVPAEYQFAYDRGLTDAKFNPVEFVRDTESIAKYGERWGALDDNDDIYPTIQGVERDPIGRVDEVVAVSEILTDDIEEAAAGNATTNSIGGALSVTINMAPHSRADHEFRSENFTVPEGKTAKLKLTWLCLVNGVSLAGVRVDTDHSEFVAIDASTGQRVSSEGLPAGTYYVSVEVRVYNDRSTTQTVTFGVNSLTATMADSVVEGWKPTFDIWVKNIWNTTKEAGESDAQYAARVWEPILGDRVGNEAKIVFSDGFMALSQDYEFVIVSYPVFDQSKMIGDVPSEWRITLRKSDAEFDATGLYIPNSQSGGKPVAGDHFFFTGIDMPFIYVQWAEQNLNAVKTTELEKLSDISPTWVITLDKVRVHTLEDEDYGTLLADRLSAGCTVRTKDSRFTNGDVLTLYVQTITYNWEEPSDDQPYLVPDINVVLSDKVVSVESSVQKIQGDIEVIRSTYAKTSDIESVVRRVASPLFLKKTGESDSSNSPTTFASKLSSKSFVQGDIGGSGWGHYDDDEGDAVLELDKVVVRKELRVNSLVVNQIAYVGGKQIMSAAAIECNQVVEDANGYTCFFDQKQGSVANLFVVGDIALGQMFDEENAETRYYCAEVTAVGDNYIVLSKTAKDGSGVPQKGDVIVQYGNKTQTSRQYVIIRDVIGGGYERMLSGLNSVTATGDEYYYAGRQSGQTPRWFVGNASGEHAEYQNGQLNIVGRLSVRKSDGTYQSMSAYIDTVNSVTQNLQEQIDGQIQSWAGDVAPLPDEDGGTANYPANAWSDDATRLKHMGDIYVNNTTGQGYRYTRAANDGDFYWVRITDEEVAEAITKANQALTQIQGYQYLKTALADGSTIVEGGLVLTNLIQLGKEESGQFQVYSGINGLMDTTAKGNGIAAWYGGPMGDKEDGAVSWAKSLFRFDGSGYLASGNIGWNADGSGHIPGITWNGNNITIAGDVQLGSVSGDTVTSMINLLRQINEWFGEDSDGNIYVKSNRGFYSNSFISAFGQSDTGGGGGGGIDLSAMWTNLQINESGVTGYGLQIDYHHLPTIAYNGDSGFVTSAAWSKTGSTNYLTLIRRALTASDIPSLTTSKISDLETWINGKDFLTGNETITLSGVVSGSGTTAITTSIADGKITNAMLAGSIANGKLANSAITINGSSTALGGSFSTASITAGTAGTSSATSGLSITIPYVTLNKYGIVTAYGTHTHSISKANITSAIGSTTYAPYNSAGYLPLNGGVMTGPISGVTYLSVNRAAQTTYRLDVNGTSRLAGNTSVTGTLTVGTTSTNRATTLNGTLSVLGAATFNGASTFNDNVTVDSTSSITLGNGVLTWDAQNSAWKLTGNLYATGFISAFGSSDTGGGGGGIYPSAMWANLQVNESGTTGYNLQINPGHLTTALGTYVNAITTTGSGNAITSVSKSGSALTFTKGSTFLTSHQSLANYVTLNSAQTITAVKTFSAGLSLNTDSKWSSTDRALYFASYGNNSILMYYNVDANTGLTYNPNTGALKAGSFVKRGGTASQFLKADGSVDSSAYLTTATAASTYLPLSADTRAFVLYNPTADGVLVQTDCGSSSTMLEFIIEGNAYTGGKVIFSRIQCYYYLTTNSFMNEGAINYGIDLGPFTVFKYNGIIYLWFARTSTFRTFRVSCYTQLDRNNRVVSISSGAVPDSDVTATVTITSYQSYNSNNLTQSVVTGLIGSTTYAPYNADGYLPLSGGTMTGSLVLSNSVYLSVKDSGGTARGGVFLDSSNNFYVGYGTSAAGYNTYLGGNQIYFQYGTGHAIGMTLGSDGKLVMKRNIVLPNDVSLQAKATNGTAYAIAYLDSSNALRFGHATAPRGYNTYLYGNNVYLAYGTSQTNGLVLTAAGNVGIGTTSPSYKLDVTGVIHSTTGIFSNGYVSAFGQSTTSDARLKKDFLDTTLTVDNIAHAPAITFLWKDREGKRQAGSLAQYWETVLPEVVTDIEGKKGLDYGAAALVSAITIARDVNDHEKRIRELERENRELKRRLGYAN